MRRLITWDDFIETYTKFHQRGFRFITSKFKINDLERAKTAFNHTDLKSANWWIIPAINKRWNSLITGNKNTSAEAFVMNKFLGGKQDLKMLSLGSGGCASELKFADYSNFNEIVCTDIADKPMAEAKRISTEKK